MPKLAIQKKTCEVAHPSTLTHTEHYDLFLVIDNLTVQKSVNSDIFISAHASHRGPVLLT